MPVKHTVQTVNPTLQRTGSIDSIRITDAITIETDRRDLSLLPANSTKLERSLTSITEGIERTPVPFADVWDIDKAPDSFLPFLAYAWSVDEWNDAWSPATQRAVIKNSLWVHQRKGTLGAVKRVLEAMNYDSEITEWFAAHPKGTPGTFSLMVSPTSGVITDTLDQIRAVVDAVKRLSAHYDVYFGTLIGAPVCAYGAAIVGVEIKIST